MAGVREPAGDREPLRGVEGPGTDGVTGARSHLAALADDGSLWSAPGMHNGMKKVSNSISGGPGVVQMENN